MQEHPYEKLPGFKHYTLTRKTALILGLGIIVAIAAGYGVYVLRSYQQPASSSQPTTSYNLPPTSSEVDISDWKTYRNEEFGFEIRYPSDAQVRETKFADSVFGVSIIHKNANMGYGRLYPDFSIIPYASAKTYGYCGDDGFYDTDVKMFVNDFGCRTDIYIPACPKAFTGKENIAIYSSYGEARARNYG